MLGSSSTTNLISVRTTATYFKGQNLYKKATLGLIVCSALLLISVIVTSILYITSSHRIKLICTTDECLRSAADLLRSMNLSTDPCEDFHQFTCGRWDQVHVNQGWRSKFSIIGVIQDQVGMVIEKFLQSEEVNHEPLPVRQSRRLYQSCLDQNAANNLGYTVLHKYLKKVGLPLVPGFFLSKDVEKFDWIKVSAKLKKLFNVNLFVQFRIVQNSYNNSIVEFLLMPGNFSPTLPSQFLTDDEDKDRLEVDDSSDPNEAYDSSNMETSQIQRLKLQWKEYIRVVLENATHFSTDQSLEDAVELLWNVTIFIQKIARDTNTQTPARYYTVQELQNATDECLESENTKPFDFYKPFILNLFEDIPESYFEFEFDFILVPANRFGAICKILAYVSESPDEVIELFIWWTTVKVMILSTTTEIRDFGRVNYVNPNQVTSRSRHCSELVQRYMSHAISYGIVERNFVNSTKPKVENMLAEIKSSFMGRIKSLAWMDQSTKSAALAKAEKMLGFIGFPDWLLNRTALEAYYGNITITSTSFLDNIVQLSSVVPRLLSRFKSPSSRQMKAYPIEINAYYYSSDNTIQIPMAILTFPMYNLGLEVLNFGSFGSVLGHEFTHGFDSNGRYFDNLGNRFGWWTHKTDNIFKKKASCFIDQYNSFHVESLNMSINGVRTLAENLADNGGLNTAYTAYQNYKNSHKEEPNLPGFENFTKEQMFFIAFGSLWCDVKTDQQLAQQIERDVHSPQKYRVIGTLQNSKDFAKAFKCPLGSKMNPRRERCIIW